MKTMNKYRLSSDCYKRETEEEQIEPKKVYFLSVEGNSAEVQYFEGVSSNRKDLGIDALVDTEVLRRKDTLSAPEQVMELLEEYLNLRQSSKKMRGNVIPEEFVKKWGEDVLRKYVSGSVDLSIEKRKKITDDLVACGIDLEYRRFLAKYDNDEDQFCIVIDRDKGSHSETTMRNIIAKCRKKKYHCYLSNPC